MKKTFRDITGLSEPAWSLKRARELLATVNPELISKMTVDESGTEINIAIKYSSIVPKLDL